jgi:hypothetical protein
LFFFQCGGNTPKDEASRIVTEWSGKIIKFPSDASCFSLANDSLEALKLMDNTPFKVLLYTDSVGCAKCELGLDIWNILIKEADSTFHGKLSFLFYFQPKYVRDLQLAMQEENFTYPVFIDRYNSIEHLNGFPKDDRFRCFLLDKDNKVVLIGNPVLNPAIWELYKKVIRENSLP